MSTINGETLKLISPYGGEPAIFNVQPNVKIPVNLNVNIHTFVN